MSDEPRIWEVVFTGGACAGKTSGMARVVEALEPHVGRVLVVPELATRLIEGGLSDIGALAVEDPERFYAIEKEMLLMVRSERQRYRQLACALGQDCVILYDRAEADICAYVGRARFERMLAETRLGYDEVRDSYDAVIHMVTAAIGAEQHYTRANNAARYETAEQAREMDRRTLDAWTGAKLSIIDNSTDFEAKMRRTIRAVLHTLGIPAPLEIERKFLLDSPDLSQPALCGAQVFEIEQTYLRSDSPHVERRVRRRSHAGQQSFTYTVKRSGTDPTSRMETEARISRAEYDRLRADAGPTVRKIRRVFVHGTHVFELDSFPDRDLHILEVELPDVNATVELPPFLAVQREVTDDPAFRNSALAGVS
jgi:CYTH domain-containing protein/thymidylate kinase